MSKGRAAARRVVLASTAPTDWDAAGRILGRVEPRLSATAGATLAQLAEELRPLGVKRLHCGPDDLSLETARSLARLLDGQARGSSDLAEVDFGLWTGLTDDDLRARFASAFKQLSEAPLSVTPPDGENLGAATERLHQGVLSRLRRPSVDPCVLVLRPAARALLRHRLASLPAGQLWSAVRDAALVTIEVDPAAAGS